MSRASFSRVVVTLVLVLAGSLGAWAQVDQLPFLTGRVNDQADILDDAAERALTDRLAALEQQTGAQVAVLTMPSLEGEDIEGFSVRVVDEWKLGREGIDDGALILVVPGERAMRIEVGYGLEGAVPDAVARRILDEQMAPRFRNGDFAGGVGGAVDALSAAIRDEELPPPAAGAVRARGGDPVGSGCLVFLVFLVVIVPMALGALVQPGRQAWIQYAFLMPFFLFLPLAVAPALGLASLGAWIVGFPILRAILRATGLDKTLQSRVARRATRSRGRGVRGGGVPWIIPGGSSRGGGFGGFSGGGGFGGFSGGGGGFGGGGASGSW